MCAIHRFLKDLDYSGFIMRHLNQQCLVYCSIRCAAAAAHHFRSVRFAVNFVRNDVERLLVITRVERELITVLCDNGDYYPKFGFASFMLVLDK